MEAVAGSSLAHVSFYPGVICPHFSYHVKLNPGPPPPGSLLQSLSGLGHVALPGAPTMPIHILLTAVTSLFIPSVYSPASPIAKLQLEHRAGILPLRGQLVTRHKGDAHSECLSTRTQRVPVKGKLLEGDRDPTLNKINVFLPP